VNEVAAVIFILGMAATALGATQQQKPKSFDSTTLPQQVIDVYKSGLPSKQYVSETIKNPASLELIKLDLGNANIECGGQGPDVRTNKVVCNPAVSFLLILTRMEQDCRRAGLKNENLSRCKNNLLP
jgi:hypothetical protein